MKYFLNNILKKIIFTIGILLVTLCFTATGTYADDEKSHEGEYLYALRISSGVESGEAVSLFSVRYKSGGKAYTYSILPYEGAYQDSLKMAAEAGELSTNTTMLEKNGYSLKSFKESTPLQPNSTDTYLFYLPRKIDSVEFVSLYSNVGSTKGGGVSWTCKGLDVFSVSKINGLRSNGGYNNNYYIDFEGTTLVQMVNKGSSDVKMVSKGKGDTILTFFNEEYGYNSKAYLAVPSEEEKSFKGSTTTVYVEMDIADVLGAGVENFSLPKDQTDYYLPELLALRYYYEDIYGAARCVSVPVMTSALSFAYEQGILKTSDSLAEFFAQGDSILLKLEIYQYGDVYQDGDNIGFIFDPVKAAEECGLVEKEEAKVCHNQIIEKIKNYQDNGDVSDDNGDSLFISGISVYYNLTNEKVGLSLDNGTKLTFSINDVPSYNYAAMSYKGDELAFSSSLSEHMYTLVPYNSKVAFRPSDPSQKFVVVLHTSPFEMAGTIDELKIKLGYTTKKNGEVIYTEDFLVRDLVKNYYGPWEGTTGDASYEISTKAGGYIYGLISLNGVYEFESATFTLAGSDSWQCKDIYIYQVGKAALKGRHIQWLSTNMTNGSVSTDRLIYRPFNQGMLGITSEGYVAVTQASNSASDEKDFSVVGIGGVKAVVSCKNLTLYLDSRENHKTIDFSTGTQVVAENVEEEDWRETGLTKEMPYSETRKDLGFTQKKCEYTVKVHVGTEKYSNTTNGDPGSSNYFYFQLVFQNGKSSFVQANQQLAADAFIAGETASFVISTNYDYGEIEYINIIPDDSSSNASPYDKLKIDYIEVVLETGGNSSLTWTCKTNELNQWVGIDYVEESEEANEIEEKSRDVDDYMRTYPVSSRNTNSQVLVAFQTAGGNGQLEASSIQATFHYTKMDGTEDVLVKDVIEGMYTFMGFTPQENTDPNHMLKPNQTNYFIMSVSDVSSFDYVDIAVKNAKDTAATWEIKNFTISLIREDNGHKLSELAGGEVILDGKTDVITTATASSIAQAKRTIAPGANASTYSIAFEENKVVIEEADTEEYFLTRVPESKNDYLNVYVYIKDDGKTDESAVLSCAVNYGTVEGTYQRSSPTFKTTEIGGQKVYYANGLGAKNFQNLCSVSLATQSRSVNAYIEKVVIQQVREKVIIDTFVFYCMGVNVKEKQIFYSHTSASTFSDTTEYEEVYIQLGPETSAANLVASTNDVAVALKYKLAAGSTNVDYQTPFVFLTDQDITKIGPNKVIKVRIKQTAMKEITGIVIAATGNKISLDVESAAVGWYVSDPAAVINNNRMTATDSGYRCKAWYSTTIEQTITAGQKTFAFDGDQLGDVSKAIVPIGVYIDTMSDELQNVSITGDAKIAMSLVYTKSDGTQDNLLIENILDYCEDLTNTSFKSGSSDQFYFMGRDMTSITYVVFYPYDEDANVTQQWGLANLHFSYGDGVSVIDKKYNDLNRMGKETDLLFEEYHGVLVGLKEVSLELTLKYGSSGEKEATISESIVSDPPIFTLYRGQTEMTISASLLGSGLGAFGIASKDKLQDSNWMLTAMDEDSLVYKFTPGGASLAEDYYEVKMFSVENPEANVVFYVVISSLEDPEKEAETSSAETSSEESSTQETTNQETTTQDPRESIQLDFSVVKLNTGSFGIQPDNTGSTHSIFESFGTEMTLTYTVYNPVKGISSGKQFTTGFNRFTTLNGFYCAPKEMVNPSLYSEIQNCDKLYIHIDGISCTNSKLESEYRLILPDEPLEWTRENTSETTKAIKSIKLKVSGAVKWGVSGEGKLERIYFTVESGQDYLAACYSDITVNYTIEGTGTTQKYIGKASLEKVSNNSYCLSAVLPFGLYDRSSLKFTAKSITYGKNATDYQVTFSSNEYTFNPTK